MTSRRDFELDLWDMTDRIQKTCYVSLPGNGIHVVAAWYGQEELKDEQAEDDH